MSPDLSEFQIAARRDNGGIDNNPYFDSSIRELKSGEFGVTKLGATPRPYQGRDYPL